MTISVGITNDVLSSVVELVLRIYEICPTYWIHPVSSVIVRSTPQVFLAVVFIVNWIAQRVNILTILRCV